MQEIKHNLVTATGSCSDHNRLFTEVTRSIAFIHEVLTKVFHQPGYIKCIHRRSQCNAIGSLNFFYNWVYRCKLRAEFLTLANT